MSRELTPIRRLYRDLCKIQTEECLLENLSGTDGFSELVGDPEPRFCEWAYAKIQEKMFYKSLVPSVLRRTEVKKIADLYGECEPESIIDADLWLGQLLRKHHSIHEPCIPVKVNNGLDVIRAFYSFSSASIKKGIPSSTIEESQFSDDPVAACRRATERLMKTITLFLFDAEECNSKMKYVWEKGLFGFRAPKVVKTKQLGLFIQERCEIGTLNHFLKAYSDFILSENTPLLFLKSDIPLWPARLFNAFEALSTSLNWGVHDMRKSERERLVFQTDSVKRILDLDRTFELHLPSVIQFFRKYDDGNKVYHYDGYRDDGTLVHFYESGLYELHKPYLYLSATNPSCVNAVCTDVMPLLNNPV